MTTFCLNLRTEIGFLRTERVLNISPRRQFIIDYQYTDAMSKDRICMRFVLQRRKSGTTHAINRRRSGNHGGPTANSFRVLIARQHRILENGAAREGRAAT